jgi:ubiquitin thioesterase protein OTUB1
MFQPQPTPFTTSSSFASYGLASDLDFAFPVSAGGGGTTVPTTTAGYYNSPALAQSHSHSHLQSQSQAQSQPQHQHHHHHQQSHSQQQPHLVHQQQLTPRQRQISTSSAAPSSASPYSNGASNSISPVISQASNSNPSSSPSLAQPQDRQRLLQHQHQQPQYQHQPQVVLKMEDQGQHDMAAQQAAARDYQPVLEGLKVGNKILSDAITNEYAKADPVCRSAGCCEGLSTCSRGPQSWEQDP